MTDQGDATPTPTGGAIHHVHVAAIPANEVAVDGGEALDAMTEVRPLDEVMSITGEILKGQVRGRTVIDVGG